jgi:hypothetical protein
MNAQAAGPRDLDGKVAIVTGASSGIGRACAVALAQRGATVLAVARDAVRLDTLQRETGAIACAISIDTPEACEDVVKRARQLGEASILINNAGLGGYLDRTIFDQTSADWRRTMAVNLDAPFELSRHVAQDIRAAGFGRIIDLVDEAGRQRRPCRPMRLETRGYRPIRSPRHCSYGGHAMLFAVIRIEMMDRDAAQRRKRHDCLTVWTRAAQQNPAKRILDVRKSPPSSLLPRAAGGINGEAITVSIGSNW